MAGLYNGLFVMSDRQTGSVWTHYDGTILTGPLADTGVRLEVQSTLHLRWKDWLERYPDSSVMDWDERFADQYRAYEPGQPGLGQQFVDTLILTDDRLPENELVVGVNVGTSSSAFPLADHDDLTVLNVTIGDVAAVVVLDPASVFGIAYAATVDGETRQFSVADGEIVDDTGASWGLDGSGADGQLKFITSFVTEWYGWVAYFPQTEIHGH